MIDYKELQKTLEPEPPPVPEQGSLLRKYELPVSCLDFPYVESCKNARELEKVVHILKSGEEGHFPQLLQKAEDKLRELKPNSRFLRNNETVLSRNMLDKEQQKNLLNDFNTWLEEINENNEELSKNKTSCLKKDMPSVRESQNLELKENNTGKPQRIKSTDYESWDKFDVDTEILKMDIEDEKMKKDAEKMEKIKPKQKKVVRINEFTTKAEASFEANREKEKGNEFFKAGEYKEALQHYTMSISYNPCAVAYTNRAITYIKLKKYEKAIDDCNKALKYEPYNFKAFLRLAQSHEHLENYSEAMDYIEEAINIDPNNTVAQELAERVRTRCGHTIKNTRMKIVEIDSESTINKNDSIDRKVHLQKHFNNPKKSILKQPTQNKTTVIPIPGPSRMHPPYFRTINSDNPQDIKIATREVDLTRQRRIMSMPLIDIESDEDERFDKTNIASNDIYPVRGKKGTFVKRSKSFQDNVNSKEDSFKQESRGRRNSADVSFSIVKKLAETEGVLKEQTNYFKEVEDLKIKDDVIEENELADNWIVIKETDIPSLQSSKCRSPTTVTNEHCIQRVNSGNLNHNIMTRKDEKAGGEPFIEEQPPDMVEAEELQSPFTFLRTWNSISRDSTFLQQAEVLRKLDTNRLVEVIGFKLDSSMLSGILQTLYKHFAVASEIDRVFNILVALSRIPRFDIMAMFMSRSDKTCVQNLIEFLNQHDKSLPDDHPPFSLN